MPLCHYLKSKYTALAMYKIFCNTYFNTLSVNFTKWSNALKQFVGKFTNCLSLFDHFKGLALKELTRDYSVVYKDSLSLHKASASVTLIKKFLSTK